MEIGQRGLDLIKRFEGYSSRAYLCPAGVWTIGYGTTRINGLPVRPGMTCDHEEAEEWLRQDCNTTAAGIYPLIYADLHQNQVDALISFAYNLGVGAFKSSSLRRAINTGQEVYEDLFTRWSKARDPRTGKLRVLPGLLARRKQEYVLFSEVSNA